MVCITALTVAQLCVTGQDGAIVTTVSSIIAGIAGYELKGYQVEKQTAE